jgi:hypothetical protein
MVPVTPFWPLRQDIPQHGIIAVFVHVVHADMALQVVWSGVFALLVWAERAAVAGGVVDEAVPRDAMS